jgi:hypothetical protein
MVVAAALAVMAALVALAWATVVAGAAALVATEAAAAVLDATVVAADPPVVAPQATSKLAAPEPATMRPATARRPRRDRYCLAIKNLQYNQESPE